MVGELPGRRVGRVDGLGMCIRCIGGGDLVCKDSDTEEAIASKELGVHA